MSWAKVSQCHAPGASAAASAAASAGLEKTIKNDRFPAFRLSGLENNNSSTAPHLLWQQSIFIVKLFRADDDMESISAFRRLAFHRGDIFLPFPREIVSGASECCQIRSDTAE